MWWRLGIELIDLLLGQNLSGDVSMDGLQRGAASGVDWDVAGTLSIVVQGAIFHGNLVETATVCRHWRDLFPNAELILSISVTDILYGDVIDGRFTHIRLVRALEHDGHLKAALNDILRSCTAVGLSAGGLPLPPIKSDSGKLNNSNLMIVAARHGLAMATGTYVLRIRNDMLFADRSFLQQYLQGEELPRGDASAFRKRVMISWLFTLDPRTVERLPLHFSDWFHFGLLDDVRRIWDVPPIKMADAVYYRTHPHAPHSNDGERLFNIRIGIEQHIAYHCFKPVFPDLTLDYHNDPTSIDLAMNVLADNFVICDLRRARCIFDKYARDLIDPAKRVHCIPREQWMEIAKERQPVGRMAEDGWGGNAEMRRGAARLVAPAVESRAFEDDMLEALPPVPFDDDAFADGGGFPLHFSARQLRTHRDRSLSGEITATATDGVLFFGPYFMLPAGRYLATVRLSAVKGRGAATLKVTQDSGGKVLAIKKMRLSAETASSLQIAFEVAGQGASGLEVVCSVKGLAEVRAAGVVISEQTTGHAEEARWPLAKFGAGSVV
jgi:hypothetical protein